MVVTASSHVLFGVIMCGLHCIFFLVDTAAALMEKRSVIFMVRTVLTAILGFMQNFSLTKVF